MKLALPALEEGKGNYHEWSLRMEVHLMEKGLEMYVSDDDPSTKTEYTREDDRKARALILKHVDFHHLVQVKDERTAQAVWQKLKQLHTDNAQARISQLLYMFVRRQCGEELDDIEQHIAEQRRTHAQLNSTGVRVEYQGKSMMGSLFLATLPATLDQWRAGYQSHREDFAFEEVTRALVEELHTRRYAAGRRGDVDSSSAIAAAARERQGKRGTKKAGKAGACFVCGKVGHFKNECPDRKEKEIAGKGKKPTGNASFQQSDGEDEVAGMAFACDASEDDDADDEVVSERVLAADAAVAPAERDWWWDSGASRHYCGNRSAFTDYQAYDPPKRVTIANGTVLPVRGRGTVVLRVAAGNQRWRRLRLADVAYVPEFTSNLLSLGTLAKRGLHWESATGGARILDAKGQVAALATMMSNNTYRLSVCPPAEQIACVAHDSAASSADTTASQRSVLDVWHARMGHLHQRALQQLLTSGIAEDVRESTKSVSMELAHCESCVGAKHHRTAVPKTSHGRSNRVLGRVHMDLSGPFAPSHSGKRYMLLISDDCTNHDWVALLAKKSEAFAAFQRYVLMAEAQHSCKIARLRSDNGGEFMSREFGEWLALRGIQRERTTAGNPHQNGVAERAMRTLLEMALSMVLAAGLPKSFWGLAVQAAVYIRNRCPTRKLPSGTPYEAWYGVKPRIGHIRPFGCLAYSLIPKEKRTKFSGKAVPGIFVGYAADSSAYLLWQDGRLQESRDVRFAEHTMGSAALAGKSRAGEGSSGDALRSPATNMYDVLRFDADDDSDGEEDSEDDVAQQQQPVPAPAVAQAPAAPAPAALAPAVPAVPGPASAPRGPRGRGGKGPGSRGGKGAYILKQLQPHNQPGNRELVMQSLSSPSSGLPSESAMMAMAATEMDDDPRTLKEALSRPDAAEWKAAADAEMNALAKAGTYTLTELPTGRQAIGCKFVFKKKTGKDGELLKYKARLVARGDSQREGIDYEETFSPVVRRESFRFALAYAAQHGLKTRHFDITAAYLYGDLDEEIYMRQAEGYAKPGEEHLVWRLNKGLYGLRQAGRAWNAKIDQLLKKHGFEPLDSDHCLYVKVSKGSRVILALYVDDMVVGASTDAAMADVRALLSSAFALQDLGEASYVLGMEIRRDLHARTLRISQATYAEALLRKWQMADCKPVSTPAETDIHKRFEQAEAKADQKTDQEVDQKVDHKEIRKYQALIGGLLYLVTGTRPDLAFAVQKLAQYASKPNESCWDAVKRVLRYVRGTTDFGITYTGSGGQHQPAPLSGYCDADWAEDRRDRRSVSGYVFKLVGGAISWKSQKQRTVALSSTEAEYMATTQAVKEAMWWRALLEGVGYDVSDPTEIRSDNQGSIALARNPVHHQRTKHIDVQYHFNRQAVAEGLVRLTFVGTEEQAADVMTKALPRVKHQRALEQLGVRGN
ncbi:MAG: reverse transcriptase domain-containing protein [Bryobacteraceae bacterium]